MKKQPRPDEPEESVWYRGWEAGPEEMAGKYSDAAYIAYLGGADKTAPQFSAPDWSKLLDLIDEHEDWLASLQRQRSEGMATLADSNEPERWGSRWAKPKRLTGCLIFALLLLVWAAWHIGRIE